MNLLLNNKVVIVTGASSGIGLAIANALLKEGAKVVCVSRSLENLRNGFGRYNKESLLLCVGDITKEACVSQFFKEATDFFGHVDSIVINHGGPQLKEFSDISLDEWDQAYNLILKSVISVIKKAVPFLQNADAPSILSISSITAKEYIPGLILSNTFRPAVIGLIKALSHELGKYPIRINSLLPGSVLTERLNKAIEAQARKSNLTKEEIFINTERSIPLGRIANPDEIASIATFLVSPVSSYINGSVLTVDGGGLKSI